MAQARIKVTARYPTAVDSARVGRYPALTFSGGGYVWDEVLEYRVWVHPGDGDDYFCAFATYPKALAFSKKTRGAEAPLVLIKQRQWIDEPKVGQFIHMKKVRITEWNVAWLARPRRTAQTLKAFFAPDAPPNRLSVIRGVAKRARKKRETTN